MVHQHDESRQRTLAPRSAALMILLSGAAVYLRHRLVSWRSGVENDGQCREVSIYSRVDTRAHMHYSLDQDQYGFATHIDMLQKFHPWRTLQTLAK